MRSMDWKQHFDQFPNKKVTPVNAWMQYVSLSFRWPYFWRERMFKITWCYYSAPYDVKATLSVVW